ncbi:MAG: hypothetical protein NT069_27040, partial [Planctomycetota bacterium]|nr:hypothetical protein [Planctomycetota bacterium]
MFNFLSSLSSRSRGASSRKRRPFQSGLAVASEVLEARQLLTGGTFSPAAALQQANHAGLGLQLPPQVHYDIVSGHNLKSIDNSYPVHDDATPYKYAYLGNSYTFSFGSGGAKVTIGDKPLTVIIDDTSDTTPFVYAKVSTPVGSLAIAYDQGGGIPMSLTVAAAAPTHHEITTGRTTIDVIVASPSITGNFYISGYASIGIPDLPLSLNVGGEALFNLRGSLMDRVQTGALNLTSIADGHYNKGDLIGSDSSL